MFRLWLVFAALWATAAFFVVEPQERFREAHQPFMIKYEAWEIKMPVTISDEEAISALALFIRDQKKNRGWSDEQFDAAYRAKYNVNIGKSLTELNSALRNAKAEGRLLDARVIGDVLEIRRANPHFGEFIPANRDIQFTDWTPEKSASVLLSQRPAAREPFAGYITFAWWAVLPPLSLVLVGFTTAWVIKGFKNT